MRPFGNTLTRAQNPSKLGTRERRIKRCSVQSALPLVKTTGSGIPNPSWAGLANTLEQATKPGAATIERHTPSHLHIRSPKTQTGPNPRRPTTRKLASLGQATIPLEPFRLPRTCHDSCLKPRITPSASVSQSVTGKQSYPHARYASLPFTQTRTCHDSCLKPRITPSASVFGRSSSPNGKQSYPPTRLARAQVEFASLTLQTSVPPPPPEYGGSMSGVAPRFRARGRSSPLRRGLAAPQPPLDAHAIKAESTKPSRANPLQNARTTRIRQTVSPSPSSSAPPTDSAARQPLSPPPQKRLHELRRLSGSANQPKHSHPLSLCKPTKA